MPIVRGTLGWRAGEASVLAATFPNALQLKVPVAPTMSVTAAFRLVTNDGVRLEVVPAPALYITRALMLGVTEL